VNTIDFLIEKLKEFEDYFKSEVKIINSFLYDYDYYDLHFNLNSPFIYIEIIINKKIIECEIYSDKEMIRMEIEKVSEEKIKQMKDITNNIIQYYEQNKEWFNKNRIELLDKIFNIIVDKEVDDKVDKETGDKNAS